MTRIAYGPIRIRRYRSGSASLLVACLAGLIWLSQWYWADDLSSPMEQSEKVVEPVGEPTTGQMSEPSVAMITRLQTVEPVAVPDDKPVERLPEPEPELEPEMDIASDALKDQIELVLTGLAAEIEEDVANAVEKTTVTDPEKPNEATSYEGQNRDGEELAALSIQGADDMATIGQWVSQGLAVLELKTPNGLVIAFALSADPGDPYRSLGFKRVGDIEDDPRSELRIIYTGKSPIPKKVLEFRLSSVGKGSVIETIDVVFTHKAVSQILQAQNQVLASLGPLEDSLRPANLELSICFESGEVRVGGIEEVRSGQVLMSSQECG